MIIEVSIKLLYLQDLIPNIRNLVYDDIPVALLPINLDDLLADSPGVFSFLLQLWNPNDIEVKLGLIMDISVS